MCNTQIQPTDACYPSFASFNERKDKMTLSPVLVRDDAETGVL
jgi:hypothetical protein